MKRRSPWAALGASPGRAIRRAAISRVGRRPGGLRRRPAPDGTSSARPRLGCLSRRRTKDRSQRRCRRPVLPASQSSGRPAAPAICRCCTLLEARESGSLSRFGGNATTTSSAAPIVGHVSTFRGDSGRVSATASSRAAAGTSAACARACARRAARGPRARSRRSGARRPARCARASGRQVRRR